jgi:hypothetical protein
MKDNARNMRSEAERVQLELFRSATPTRRAGLALSWSQTVMSLARRALERVRPEAQEDEISMLFVQLHYGRELGERLRQDLARRRG